MMETDRSNISFCVDPLSAILSIRGPAFIDSFLHSCFEFSVEFHDDERFAPGAWQDAGKGLSQWSMKRGEESVAHRVASAAEAVKGLRSPSLAPMNAANYKTVRAALDCLPRYGWKVHKGSCRSPS